MKCCTESNEWDLELSKAQSHFKQHLKGSQQTLDIKAVSRMLNSLKPEKFSVDRITLLFDAAGFCPKSQVDTDKFLVWVWSGKLDKPLTKSAILKRTVIQERQLHHVGISGLKTIFASWDLDRDGFLSKGEFSAAMSSFDREFSSEEISVGFHEIDTNGADALDLTAFAEWLLPSNFLTIDSFYLDRCVEAHALMLDELNGKRGLVTGFREDRVLVKFEGWDAEKCLKPRNLRIIAEDYDRGKLRALFRHFDSSNACVISNSDLERVLQSADPIIWSRSRLEALMLTIDANQDGLIQYSEFVAWLRYDAPEQRLFIKAAENSLAQVLPVVQKPAESGLAITNMRGEQLACIDLPLEGKNVIALKHAIAEQTLIPVASQKLIVGCKVLELTELLENVEFGDPPTILLIRSRNAFGVGSNENGRLGLGDAWGSPNAVALPSIPENPRFAFCTPESTLLATENQSVLRSPHWNPIAALDGHEFVSGAAGSSICCLVSAEGKLWGSTTEAFDNFQPVLDLTNVSAVFMATSHNTAIVILQDGSAKASFDRLNTWHCLDSGRANVVSAAYCKRAVWQSGWELGQFVLLATCDKRLLMNYFLHDSVEMRELNTPQSQQQLVSLSVVGLGFFAVTAAGDVFWAELDSVSLVARGSCSAVKWEGPLDLPFENVTQVVSSSEAVAFITNLGEVYLHDLNLASRKDSDRGTWTFIRVDFGEAHGLERMAQVSCGIEHTVFVG